MPESSDFRLFRHFIGHVLIATALFFVVAGAAVVVEAFADWIEAHGSLVIAVGCHFVAYIIFFIDVGCLLFFLSIQGYKFVRETWTFRKP